MNHILTAASKGMKAGYNQRKRTIQRGGLNVAVGSFSDYCAKFGPDVTAAQSTMRNRPRHAAPTLENSLEREIEAARTRLAELEAKAAAEAEKPKRERKPKAEKSEVKVNTWHPWAVRKHEIPTTVGATFTYKGKRRTSTFQVTKVTRDGSVESIRVS
jgi:cell division septation protein DedD